MGSIRTIVGMSGGVDSSVAALRLRDAGEAIAGLHMTNWSDDADHTESVANGTAPVVTDAQDSSTVATFTTPQTGVQDRPRPAAPAAGSSGCRSVEDRRDAVAVCGRLGIPIHFRDFSREYWDGVFRHFLDDYAAGRTPNPDVLCNREIKFRHFLDAAHQLGAERIATGHYARVQHDTTSGHRLLRAVDRSKDQSYFLHQLGQAQLAGTLFPLGELHKTEIRAIARAASLPTAAKKDSTGICFIGERDFRTFLAQYLPAREGEMRTPDEHLIGLHPGVFYFTIGQREGLQIGGVRGFAAAPWYVVGKDVERNVLYVDQGVQSPWLVSQRLWTERAHWVSGAPPASRFECTAQTRYRQLDEPCRVDVRSDGTLYVEFASPQRAVTPGQSLVLYDGELCLGGAIIDSTDALLETRIKARAA